jgi:nicotinamide-nucleotide amidase
MLDQVEKLSQILRQKKLMLTTAESCTAGMISAAITDLPGSSDILERGFITYSNQSKIDLLGVYATTLEAHGAVSEQTACAMAEGALRQSKGDVAVAVTGIAGPSGGSAEKPVGLVFISVSLRGYETRVWKHLFKGNRADIRRAAALEAVRHIIEVVN